MDDEDIAWARLEASYFGVDAYAHLVAMPYLYSDTPSGMTVFLR